MKQIRINNCDDCPNKILTIESDLYCVEQGRIIDTPIGIPSWCPLEDADKGTCKWKKIPVEGHPLMIKGYQGCKTNMGMFHIPKFCSDCGGVIEVVE